MLIDLHCHSRHTRGCDLDAEAIVRRAAEVHLDGVCFTDQNTLEGVQALHGLNGAAGVKVFVGLEAATDHGHYLCFFPEPGAVPPPAQMWGGQSDRPWSAREVVERVYAAGGAAVAAHPYDRDSEYPAGDFIFTLTGLCAVEALNPRRNATANELAAEAADHLRLACVGGSDTRLSLDHLGRVATLFKRPVRTEADLVGALRAGEVWPVQIDPAPVVSRGFQERDWRDGGSRPPRRERGGRDRHRR